jgi:hypothetical protein
MSSSGTYAYAPDIGDFVDEAFERCLVDPASLTVRHARSARVSLNLLFADWANEGVLLFAVDQQTQTLTQSDLDYSAASGTLALLECSVRRSAIDTPVDRISREQYERIPDKVAEGLPSQVYFDRKTGTYYLWNAPENSTDVFRYYRLRQLQDVTSGQETPDVPYRWYEALAAGLAAKLAGKFAPQLEDKRTAQAGVALARARREDRERADTTMSIG